MKSRKRYSLHKFLKTFLLTLAAFLAVSGCADYEGPAQFSSRVVTSPVIETGTGKWSYFYFHVSAERPWIEFWIKPSDVSLAWREPGVSVDKSIIFNEFVPPVAPPDTSKEDEDQWRMVIAEPSVDRGEIAFVKLGEGDRYFIAWFDQDENEEGLSVSLLRWGILSGISRRLEERGEWQAPSGWSLAEIAAAYNPTPYNTDPNDPDNPESRTILVAFLLRNTSEFGDCLMDSRNGACALYTLPIEVNEGGIVQGNTDMGYGGPKRGLSVVAGGPDGFLVAFVGANQMEENYGNGVRVISYFQNGQMNVNNYYVQITGETDCADVQIEETVNGQTIEVLEVIEGDDVSMGYPDPERENFLDTAVAYDSDNERYLVSYITDCGNSYYRARTIEKYEGYWKVSGIDPSAYTYSTDSSQAVLEPPFQIAASASDPMLAYDDDFDSEGSVFLAAYGSPDEPTHDVSRTMLYAQFLKDDGSVIPHAPIRILKDKMEWALSYPSFISGDISAEAGRDIFYLAWAQNTHIVPCKNAWEPHDNDWVCDADLEGIKVGDPKGFFTRIEAIPDEN